MPSNNTNWSSEWIRKLRCNRTPATRCVHSFDSYVSIKLRKIDFIAASISSKTPIASLFHLLFARIALKWRRARNHLHSNRTLCDDCVCLVFVVLHYCGQRRVTIFLSLLLLFFLNISCDAKLTCYYCLISFTRIFPFVSWNKIVIPHKKMSGECEQQILKGIFGRNSLVYWKIGVFGGRTVFFLREDVMWKWEIASNRRRSWKKLGNGHSPSYSIFTKWIANL